MKFNSRVLSLKNMNILKNKNLIAAFFSVFSGLILGVVAFITISETESIDLLNLLVKFNTDFSDKSKLELFCGIALSGLPYYFAMLIVGGSIFGRLLCEIFTSVKAMGISIVASFLYANMGLKGLEYALLVFFPGKVILIFALLFITATSIEMSKSITVKDKTDLSLAIKGYIIKYAVILLLFILSWGIDFLCNIIFSDLF